MAFYRYIGRRQVYEIDRRDATKFPMPSMQWMEVTEPDIQRFLEAMIENGSPRFEKKSDEPEVMVEVKAKRSRKKKPEEIRLEQAAEPSEPEPEVKTEVAPEPVPEPVKVEAKVEEDDDPLGGI
jgi:cell division protein FtsN